MKELGIYVHIPFCIRKCLYCDFYSMAANEDVKSCYVEALIRQIEAESRLYSDDFQVVSVFFGGGTPSILNPEYIRRILMAIRDGFVMSNDCEITIECNPGTVNLQAFKAYKAMGINRISMGLQSVNDNELQAVGRIHTFRDFMQAYENAMKAGIDNINVDIMSTLPGQTIESYRKTLKTICALRPSHISSYSLILEEGTPLYDMVERGEVVVPSEDVDRELYAITGEELARAGYERYEISNYARDGKICRHNTNYWRRVSYLGIGAGASSLLKNVRYDIEKNIEKYIANPLDCYINRETLSVNDEMSEYMFLGLRMMEGVNADAFRMCFGRQLQNVWGNVIDRYVASGHLQWKGNNLSLTPKGIDVSNYIFSDFV